jgi:hypothetical protein
MRRTAVAAALAAGWLLAACGQGADEGPAAADHVSGAARCPASLPALSAEVAPPITTMATMPGQAPGPVARYGFAGAVPTLPSDAPAYCFDPTPAAAREDRLRDALDADAQDQLTVSSEEDRAWQYFRAGPTPPFGTTIPGAPPTATTVADVAEPDAREVARTVLAALDLDEDHGALEVHLEVGRWWARFTPTIGGDALTTSLEIGPGGKVWSGSGHLGEPVEAGRYRLVDAATALARVNAPLDQLAGNDRPRFDVTLQGAVVVSALRPTEAGTYLVPSIRFEPPTAESGVVGVGDEYLRS